ncbi:hypothetical protein PF003_g18365 [Phytophthora fragariae]|nr:hypothetical protein PF003_g18365 [Phytophthora fragariae]
MKLCALSSATMAQLSKTGAAVELGGRCPGFSLLSVCATAFALWPNFSVRISLWPASRGAKQASGKHQQQAAKQVQRCEAA